MTDSPLRRLLEYGQSPWLDFIGRGLLTGGELSRMIDQWGIRGVTSNPAIFERAIARTDDYRGQIERLSRAGAKAEQIYERLAFDDVRAAAELLYPVYRETGGADGFVSLEVSPHLARDAPATVSAARRLWSALDCPNVMIKVPGTREGLSAIRSLLAGGINVNVTLLFSIDRYREVVEVYLTGLEDALAAGRRLDRIASVASFFLSRIDTLIDRQLDALAAAGGGQSRPARRLRGQAAIASARLAYAVLERSLASERFRRLRREGARPQRLLWASTGAKDPAYSAIKYVEPLVGRDTVNTLPLETLEAYHETGRPAARLPGHAREAEDMLRALAAMGIDLDAATARLLDEGIDQFVQAYDALLRSLDSVARAALGAWS